MGASPLASTLQLTHAPQGAGTGRAKRRVRGDLQRDDDFDPVRIDFVGDAGAFDREGPIFAADESHLQSKAAELERGHRHPVNFLERRGW
jgi:hypothetical protein